MNYVLIIDLGADSNEFAEKLGVRAVLEKRYVVVALNAEGGNMGGAAFPLEKSVEGIPDAESIKNDIMTAWRHKNHLSA